MRDAGVGRKPFPKRQPRGPVPGGKHSSHILGTPPPVPPPPRQGQPGCGDPWGCFERGLHPAPPENGDPGVPPLGGEPSPHPLPQTTRQPSSPSRWFILYTCLKASPGEGTVTRTGVWGQGGVRMGSIPVPGSPNFPMVGCSETCVICPHLCPPPRQCPSPWDRTGASLTQGTPGVPLPPTSPAASITTDGEMGLPQAKRHFPTVPLHKGHLRARGHRTQLCPPHIDPPASPRVGEGWGRGDPLPAPLTEDRAAPAWAEVRMGLCPRAREGCPPWAGGPGTPRPLRAPTPSSASGSGGICPGWQARLSPSQARSGRCQSLPPPPSWGRWLWLGAGGDTQDRGTHMTGQGLPWLQPGTPRVTPAPKEHPEPPPQQGTPHSPPPGEGHPITHHLG